MKLIARVIVFILHGVIGYYIFMHFTTFFLFCLAAMVTHYTLKTVFTYSPLEYVAAYPEYAVAKVKYWYNQYAK